MKATIVLAICVTAMMMGSASSTDTYSNGVCVVDCAVVQTQIRPVCGENEATNEIKIGELHLDTEVPSRKFPSLKLDAMPKDNKGNQKIALQIAAFVVFVLAPLWRCIKKAKGYHVFLWVGLAVVAIIAFLAMQILPKYLRTAAEENRQEAESLMLPLSVTE